MLNYAIAFFVIALIATMLGFGGLAGMSAQVGWTFAALAMVFLIAGILSGSGRGLFPRL
jgi:uncharacterized membrane protein YtjA (UPF0391 family)